MMTHLSKGRLFMLQLERSKASRDSALATIRDTPSGWVTAKIGGRMRGKIVRFISRRAAEDAIHKHYNAALLKTIRAAAKPPSGEVSSRKR